MAFNATKQLWKVNYKEDYHVPGGMYRGEPPKEYYSCDWEERATEKVWAPSGQYLEVVGQQGASSTNPGELSTNQWTDVDGNVGTGEPAFIAAIMPSRTTRVNPNEFRKGYIYGKHQKKGLGYYHNTTKEAYEILEKRIGCNIEKVAADMACESCFCGKTKRVRGLESKMHEYQD